jgi:hypothetical protein
VTISAVEFGLISMLNYQKNQKYMYKEIERTETLINCKNDGPVCNKTQEKPGRAPFREGGSHLHKESYKTKINISILNSNKAFLFKQR